MARRWQDRGGLLGGVVSRTPPPPVTSRHVLRCAPGRILVGQARSRDTFRMPTIEPFADTLVAKLAALQARYMALLERTEIRNTDPNQGGGGLVFIGFATSGWQPNADLVNDRTRLLTDLDEWIGLFRLVHRDALPETAKRIEASESLLRRWLAQEGGDHSVPSSIDQAIAKV